MPVSQRRQNRAVVLLLSLPLGLPALGWAQASTDQGRELVDRVDRLLRGDSSIGTVQMSIVTRRWSREMTLKVWSRGVDDALIRVLEPPKERGTATLKVGPDIWNYLPRIDRTIRIPSSMMMGSWMGSHFTNDDLVKESRLVRDYSIEMTFNGEREGTQIYEFRLLPHIEAAVVWGRIELQVRKSDLMPTWERYYAEDGHLVRTLTFSEYRRMGGRLVPAVLRVVPTDKPDEHTEIRYVELEFDVPLTDDIFSLANLRK